MSYQSDNRPALPEALADLADIPRNLAWNWNREARTLFRHINPVLWRATRYNPLELLQRASPKRLEALAADDAYLERLRSVRATLDALAVGEETWFSNTWPDARDSTVAYFCAEFGLHHSIPIYSGGLGILAGDHCKSAADLGVPLVGVGLMYKKGYFDQRLRVDGWQEDSEERFDHGLAPIYPIDVDGDPVLASVWMSGRDVRIGAWKVQVGRVPVILLDTDLEANDPADRDLSGRLYAGGEELRLRQEWILGVGGVRVLRRLGYHPGAWHANEGHAAFMLLERLREHLESGLDVDTAIGEVRRCSIFTTHTPVPAGHDAFDRGLIEHAAGPVWEQIGIDENHFFDLGRHPDHEGQELHMTALAIRLSERVNGVSERHGTVTRNMWQSMWPETQEVDVPIGHVTNGVHHPTWMASRIKDLMEDTVGPDWEARAGDPEMWDAVMQIKLEDLWDVHVWLKSVLMDYIRETARIKHSEHQIEPAQLVGAGTLLSTGPLTLGFARRFATYKRADLLFRDLDRLEKLLLNRARPIQLIYAGKAHPADEPGKEILQRVYEFAKDQRFEGRIAFLEDYEMHMARSMVRGVDVWLNLPVVPMEASGTSGMKAALNGVPQLGTSDGWWAEGHTGHNGWRIPAAPAGVDVDEHDADHLYRIIEEHLVPMFYDRDTRGVPRQWVEVMQHAIREAGRQFTAGRMVMDYTRDYYVPSLGLAEQPAWSGA